MAKQYDLKKKKLEELIEIKSKQFGNIDEIDLSRKKNYELFDTIVNIQINKLKEIKLDKSFSPVQKDKFILNNINDWLLNNIQDIEINIINSKNENIRKLNEIDLDIYKKYLEDYTKKFNELNTSHITENDLYYYPDINDNLFNKKIFYKKEFNDNKIFFNQKQIESQKEIIKSEFRRSPTQSFVKNYISYNTPYNGILIWHGVGVGKTCAAISIAENFRNFVYKNNKKILVLTPGSKLSTNWRDEIFNFEKEKNNNQGINVQCTGSRYKNEINLADKKSKDKSKIDKIKKQINRLVDKYYSFSGYQKLARQVVNDFDSIKELFLHQKKNLHQGFEARKIEYIKKEFSNRVIIMDEVHTTREGQEDKDGKDQKLVPPILELIVRYAQNTKLIILSATPMYNVTKEIVWLLNLLLLNDKRAPIEEYQIFENDGINIKDSYGNMLDLNEISFDTDEKLFNLLDKSSPLKNLISKSKSYISYLRGEDPFRFPIKLNPNKIFTYVPAPDVDSSNKTIEKKDLIPENSLSLYRNVLSDWQYYHISQLNTHDIDKEESNKSSKFGSGPLQASNIVYPNYKNFEFTVTNDKALELFSKKAPPGITGGDEGFDAIFEKITTESSKNKKNIEYKYRNFSDIDLNNITTDKGFKKSIFHRDYIGEISIKFKNIINNIVGNESENISPAQGIVFIFSRYITYGIKPLALALEENGFKRLIYKSDNAYQKKNFSQTKHVDLYCSYNKKYLSKLNPEEKINFKQANYIYLDGSAHENELYKLIQLAKSDENQYGKEILVILGSSVIEQGYSFFNIRETHILEPWHHLNKIEQAAGRSIRNDSHKKLPRKHHNVTLFLHSSSLPYSKIGEDEKIETPDERTYRKAFEKKKKMAIVSKLLKIHAVDCELNKSGNIFLEKNLNPSTIKMENSKNKSLEIQLYDTDYSEKCDYGICDYTCDWQYMNPGELQINTDTYSEIFFADKIDKAKTYISALYLKNIAYTLENIIERIQEIDSSIYNNYIFLALNELISNKEDIYDIYKRTGHLIYRNGKYIFQLKSIKINNLPLYLRLAQLKYFNTEIELDELDYKKHKNYNKKILTVDTTQTKSHSKINILDNILIDNYINYKEIVEYIQRYYMEYSTNNDKTNENIDNIYPNIDDLIIMKIYSSIDRLQCLIKKNITLSILNKIRKKISINSLEKIFIDYYSNQKDTSTLKFHCIFTNKEILKTVEKNNILITGDILDSFREEKEENYCYYRYVDELGNVEIFKYIDIRENFETTDIDDSQLLKIIGSSKIDKEKNKTKCFGFLSRPSDKDKFKKLEFYVVNRYGTGEKKKTQDGSINKKNIATGAMCGNALNVRKKPEIINTINLVYSSEKDSQRKRHIIAPQGVTINENTQKSRTLCEELELLLRYKDLLLKKNYSINNDLNTHTKYFYYTENFFNKES